jgi:hypothetical protein
MQGLFENKDAGLVLSSKGGVGMSQSANFHKERES